ncbi:MAG: beta-lactamase family protein [Bacteriovoracaceae bacterium]|nr:beta-lactamase family protein [Bacteriovoracaceae bacterium]
MKYLSLLILLISFNSFALVIKGEVNRKYDNTSYRAVEPWTIEESKHFHSLISPENDLKMYFLILPALGKPNDIFLKAWRKIDPTFKLKIDQLVSPPATKGWEAIHKISYEVPIKESRLIAADYGLYKGKAYVTLIDGKYSTLQKRGAQLQLMAQSWKPDDLKEEILSDKEAKLITDKEIRILDQFLQSSMRDLKIPGLQIAMVQNGKMVWEKSFGVVKLGSKEKISSNTLFMIGSTTKPLTTLLEARLVDKKILSWDEPLYKILPSFTLKDKDVSQKLQLKHTACACTGMPRRDLDFIFEYSGISAEERLAQLKSMSPTTDFGETFQYSNLLVAAGGYAAAHALFPSLTLDAAYDKAMNQEVFIPLSMKNTRIHPLKDDSTASPHALNINNRIDPIPQEMDDMVYAVAPAGAIWSTATDLIQYILFELNNGKINEERILTVENLEKRRTPGVKVDEKAHYGLGLFIDDFKGIKTIGHGGNTLGFTSEMIFLPNQNIGWALLSNAGSSPLRSLFKQKVFEVLFEAKRESHKNLQFRLNLIQQSFSKMRAEISDSTSKTKWLEPLIGDWKSNELGIMKIEKNNKDYVADFGEWKSGLASMTKQENTFVLISAPWSGSFHFQLQKDGTLLLDAGQTKYEFKRIK